jgi:hypothetical protein
MNTENKFNGYFFLFFRNITLILTYFDGFYLRKTFTIQKFFWIYFVFTSIKRMFINQDYFGLTYFRGLNINTFEVYKPTK